MSLSWRWAATIRLVPTSSPRAVTGCVLIEAVICEEVPSGEELVSWEEVINCEEVISCTPGRRLFRAAPESRPGIVSVVFPGSVLPAGFGRLRRRAAQFRRLPSLALWMRRRL